jgi:dolichyl-phosphate beta-glucosyltransferase
MRQGICSNIVHRFTQISQIIAIHLCNLCNLWIPFPQTRTHPLPPQQNGFDLTIGSREGTGAVRYNEPEYRHFMGRIFNLLVKVLAIPNIEDTQCGFKCFHQRVVTDLFNNQTIDGFGFDVEVLYIAQKRGYNIVEIPIHWYAQAGSKVHPIRDTVRMFRDIFTVRQNDRHGMYDKVIA